MSARQEHESQHWEKSVLNSFNNSTMSGDQTVPGFSSQDEGDTTCNTGILKGKQLKKKKKLSKKIKLTCCISNPVRILFINNLTTTENGWRWLTTNYFIIFFILDNLWYVLFHSNIDFVRFVREALQILTNKIYKKNQLHLKWNAQDVGIWFWLNSHKTSPKKHELLVKNDISLQITW